MAISKLTLIGGSAGLVSATAGGVAIYLNSGESVRNDVKDESDKNIKLVEYIGSKDKTKKRKFITSVTEAHDALKKKYSGGGQHKPRKENGEVTENEIIDWCRGIESSEFSREEDATYLSVNTWCFVDTTSLLEKAKQSQKKDIVGISGDATGWQEAWNTYKTKKTEGQLTISTSGFEKLNTINSKEEGGKELYRWCQAQKDKKMYEVDAEENYKRYEKWCFQQ